MTDKPVYDPSTGHMLYAPSAGKPAYTCDAAVPCCCGTIQIVLSGCNAVNRNGTYTFTQLTGDPCTYTCASYPFSPATPVPTLTCSSNVFTFTVKRSTEGFPNCYVATYSSDGACPDGVAGTPTGGNCACSTSTMTLVP